MTDFKNKHVNITADYASEEKFDISTCWIGQQAIITFLGCICGTIGMLLFQKWIVASFCILFGIIWGTVALLLIDHAETGGFNLFSWNSIIENLMFPIIIVWAVCYFCLNIHNWGSVVVSSIFAMILLAITKNRWNVFLNSGWYRRILLYLKFSLSYFAAKQRNEDVNIVNV